MTAYCFFDVREVLDPEKLDEYKSRVLETVTRHEGRYVVLGGECESVEGAWRPSFPVLIRFPSLEKARQWYDSDEYRELKALRTAGAHCDAVFMESAPSEFVAGD